MEEWGQNLLIAAIIIVFGWFALVSSGICARAMLSCAGCGAWATEGYRVAAVEGDKAVEDALPPEPPQ